MAYDIADTMAERAAGGPERVYFLDNLRSFVILLVVVLHTGVVYENTGFGALFWIVDDPTSSELIDLVNLVLDIFLMPTLFFISGYLAPMSLERRGAWSFLVGKVKRLMRPWLIAVLVLIPLYKVIFLASRGLPQASWTTYFHFSNGLLSQSWLWFLPVLFLCNVVYLLLWLGDFVPRNRSFAGAAAAVCLLGVAMSFGMEMLGWQGWTKNALFNFQNERLLLYFMLFLAGSLGWHRSMFAGEPRGLKWYVAANALAWVPIMGYLFFFILPYVAPGKYVVSRVNDRLIMWCLFYLSLLTLLYLAFATFRRYVDRGGWLWRELDRNSYYVYIIHVIVLGLIAWPLRETGMGMWAKYVTLALTTWVVCNLIISLYWRVSDRLAASRSASAKEETFLATL